MRAIHHIAIICSDYARSRAFYRDILQLPVIREVWRAERQSWKCDLDAGNAQIELFSFPDPPARTSRPEACGLRHLAFTVAREGLLRLGDVPLAELVREVADSYPRDSLAPTFDLDVTHTSRADIALTRQLLSNLVGNAVKYTRPGQRPRIELRSHDDVEPGWVQVVVADRGVGIQPGDEQRIFDAFSRSDKDAEQVAGTGLGLALCHSIVTRHGGRNHADSNEHGGATFRFPLPKA